MARWVVSVCLVAAVSIARIGICQSTQGAGSESPAGKQPAPAAGPGNAVATVKATAQLVLVDVVVTDKGHRPVHGLQAADFAVKEGGVPQTIKQFEEHSALTQADATKFAPAQKMPPGVFTNDTPVPANGAVNLILLDALNTPMQDQAYVRQQLLAYLKATPPGTRIAIFGLTTRLTVLQGFTSDPAALRRVIEKGVSKSSELLNDTVGGGGIQNSQADDLEDSGGSVDPAELANMRQFEAEQQNLQLELRAKYTLDAMNSIARYLANIPGRKNLIWFSGSFPLNILPDTTGELRSPLTVTSTSEDEFRETVNLLARRQVAVYPIDARGIKTSPMFDVTTTRNYTGLRGAARASQDQQTFVTDTASEQSTMLQMAAATGGRAFVNTNGLTAAVSSAVEDGTNFYTLMYSPANSRWDGKLRRIHVQVSRPGLTLAYRTGYYAIDPAEKLNATVDGPTKASSSVQADALRRAMTRGVPTPTEVILHVGVVPNTPAGQTEENVVATNHVAEKMKGPYRRFSVNISVDPKGLVFLRKPDGLVYSNFDLLIFVYSAEGDLVNSQTGQVRIAMKLEDLRTMLAKGLVYHQEVSTPAKGEYFLRIGVHELKSDDYGVVEVATSEVRDVKAAATPGNAAK